MERTNCEDCGETLRGPLKVGPRFLVQPGRYVEAKMRWCPQCQAWKLVAVSFPLDDGGKLLRPPEMTKQ
jgi:hypothetical protein